MPKTNTRAKTTSERLTIYPTFSKAQAQQAFVKKVGKAKDNGSNQHLTDFLSIMDRVTCNGGSFSEYDVLRESKAYDLAINEVQHLLKQYVSTFERLGKLTIVQGCMDYPIYVIQS